MFPRIRVLAKLTDLRQPRLRASRIRLHRKRRGGSMIRNALLRRDEAEDAGKTPGTLVSFIAGLPRRMGLRLPR
jgi:hypothetical protein